MLSELAIKNFAIIDDIRISFTDGLTVLTGETGAGKSIIIEAVNLLLGGRADSDLVRTGETSAELEALFDIAPESQEARLMEQQGLDPSEGLMIRRLIHTNGKHKIFINARQSTMALLKQVTQNLASVSSQHAHQGLLNEISHLDILDRFAGTYPEKKQVAALYNELIGLTRELASLKSGLGRTQEENDLLSFQIREIENAKLSPDEDRTLEAEKLRLKSGSDLFKTVDNAIVDLYTRDNSVIETLGTLKKSLEENNALDPKFQRFAEKLSNTLFDLEDLTEELRRYKDSIDLNPEILEETEARLDQVQKLKRKYGGTLETLFKTYNTMKQKLSGTEAVGDRITQLEKKTEGLSKALSEKALSLSAARATAAKTLANLAENELTGLEMSGTYFTIDLKQTPADTETEMLFSANSMKITAAGLERAAFLLAPNPGEAPRPLSRIASGGELSRVVLALKAILSETESLGTLIFDEVDAGIGGKTAEKVGKKLARLAENYQVICITHLAQIAKYGTSHLKIEKKVINNRTATAITPLKEQQDRINEIARMMAGEKITAATLEHAKEMLMNAVSG